MKYRKYIIGSIALGIVLASCEKDGNTIYTAGPEATTLSGNAGDIILDFNHLDALVLTIFWNENGSITTSDPQVAAPSDAVNNVVQISGDQGFSTVVETTMEQGKNYCQFTCSELNNITGRVGLAGGVSSPMYVRIKSSVGSNVEPVYSNVLTFNVTPYVIDMTVGKFLNTAFEDTGRWLYSPSSDGIYEGFIGAATWENWYLAEGNGVIWGNENVNWKAFALGCSTDGTNGNMWYPGIGGCYYTIVDTQARNWSALLIPTLTIDGDIQGEMTYDRKANVWTMPISATPGTVNITISTTAKQYDVATGTDDAAAVDTPVAFTGAADGLEFVHGTPTTIAVNITESGDATLELNLSDPKQWTVGLSTGEIVPSDPINKYLYMPGIDDGIRGSWCYDSYLINYQEDVKVYGGACAVNSQWGWVVMDNNGWDDDAAYGYDSGDALSGTLNRIPTSNIPPAEPGVYVIDISLVDMSYKLTAIQSVSYAGLNDDWTMKAMTYVSGATYQATVTKNANSPWGVKIYINEDWNLYFGGRDTPGELRLFAEGFEGDNDLENGEYILTVDLATGAYAYTPANN